MINRLTPIEKRIENTKKSWILKTKTFRKCLTSKLYDSDILSW